MHIPNPYTLPAFYFVGGSTQDLIFHCYFFKTKKPQDLSACVADFSIINFVNKNGKPLLSKQMEIRPDPNRDGDVNNVVCVTLEADETVNLPAGKYIYQITIRDISGEVEIPNQGLIHIIKNINQAFIR